MVKNETSEYQTEKVKGEIATGQPTFTKKDIIKIIIINIVLDILIIIATINRFKK